ncbi:MAG: glycosyltransferase [Patescibacteria group bacterium]
MKLGIGICARNEESSIIPMLDSVRDSAQNTSTLSEWHLFVCANGCTDNTLPLLKIWIQANPQVKTMLIEFEKANLVEGQREIVKYAKREGITSIIFFDADVIVEKECVSELLLAARSDSAKAVYAVSVPIQREKQTLLESALNQYDLTPTIFSPRKHLHGRAFLIKDWNIPDTNPSLLADDIFLSFDLLKKYGPRSIVKADNARVHFHQISSYKDFYNAYCRRKNEIRKCMTLFAHFQSLPSDQVNKHILWGKLAHESFRRDFFWTVLFTARFIAKINFFLDSLRVSPDITEWKPTLSSKKTVEKPVLILIEGLDCSGKKTIAKSLQGMFIQAGIPCNINMGPLNSKTYRFLSRLVSVYQFPNFLRSIVYSFEGVGEKYWYKNFQSHVVIQISSPYRNWAYAYANNSRLRVFLIKYVQKYITLYDQVCYLTAPYEVRLQRHNAQVALGQNRDRAQDRFANEEKFMKMEYILKKLLIEGGYIINEFDTSIHNPEDIAKRLFEDYKIKNLIGNK